MKQLRSLRQTTVIMCTLAMFLAGLVAARRGVRVSGVEVAFALLLLVVASGRMRGCRPALWLLLGMLLGCWRGQVLMSQLQPVNHMIGHRVVVTGTATVDAVYDDKKQFSFQIDHLEFADPQAVQAPGKLAIGGFGENAIYRGDVVQVEGNLRAARGSNLGTISFADIKLLRHNVSPIDAIRLRFVAGLQSALPEPLASFGTGLLIGQRSTIPKTVSDELSTVGLTHIVAVSGYNLTIIVMAVVAMMKGRSKFQTFSLTLALILLFMLLTGLSASIVRAALVSWLSLWAWYYGRTFRPLLLILLAAVITAGWNPLYLWSDIGWYLSFLAFFGVLILSPLVKDHFFKNIELGLIGAVVLETISAQIMTTPIIMFIFQQISLVALVSNVLIVPWVPLAMMLTLLAGLGGMIAVQFAGWLAWPARLLLTYMLDMIHLMSTVPHAAVERGMDIAKLVWAYLLLLGICWVLWLHNRDKSGILPDNERTQ